MELTYVDPEALALLQAQAAAGVPAIFRFVPQLAEAAVADLNLGIVQSKPVFLADVEARFGPVPLGSKVVLTEEFKQFRRDWVENHKLFPPKFQIARAWATGGDPEPHLAPYRERLRQVMTGVHLREAEVEVDAMVGPAEARLVAAQADDEKLTPEAVAARATPFNRSLLQSIPKVRDEVRESMLKEDWPAARFLGTLMRPNTFFEAALTRAERQARMHAVVAPTLRQAPGDLVVRAGEMVTPRMHAALAALRRAFDQDPKPFAPARTASATPLAPAPEPASAPEDGAGMAAPASPAAAPIWANRVFFIGLPAAIAILALAVVVLAVRLPRRSALLVATPEKGQPESPVVLALRDITVQRLFGQRQELIATQDKSSDQVASLEERIARLQPQLQAKLRAYEVRIRELEEQLARRGESDADGVRVELARIRRERDAQIANASGSNA